MVNRVEANSLISSSFYNVVVISKLILRLAHLK